MKVSGFSFIRNAEKYQYPVKEALSSILPLCDEVVVAVGDSSDGTREIVSSVDPRIKLLDTVWDDGLREGGKVLASETNKALGAVAKDSDWCIYIQGDEVLHEDGYEEIKKALLKYKSDPRVDGLLFRYRHFYGSYDYTGITSRWYRNEIRAIKNDPNIYSYRDAQGFRKGENEKLNVKPLNAFIHHYGWVREPSAMFAKQRNFGSFYEGEEGRHEEKIYTGEFDYTGIDALERFKGRHPEVMKERIARMNWKFEHDPSFNRLDYKERFKNFLERVTGKRPFDFNNYKII